MVTDWLPRPLAGESVMLRCPQPGDEPALVEMATDARVREFIGGPADPAIAVQRAAQRIATPVCGQFVIVQSGTGVVVGSGDLARKRGPWEVSFQLRYAFWGRGYAYEAVSLIRDWFFAHTDEDLLIATTQVANTRSRRLLQRLGAVRVDDFELYGLRQARFEFYRDASEQGQAAGR